MSTPKFIKAATDAYFRAVSPSDFFTLIASQNRDPLEAVAQHARTFLSEYLDRKASPSDVQKIIRRIRSKVEMHALGANLDLDLEGAETLFRKVSSPQELETAFWAAQRAQEARSAGIMTAGVDDYHKAVTRSLELETPEVAKVVGEDISAPISKSMAPPAPKISSPKAKPILKFSESMGPPAPKLVKGVEAKAATGGLLQGAQLKRVRSPQQAKKLALLSAEERAGYALAQMTPKQKEAYQKALNARRASNYRARQTAIRKSPELYDDFFRNQQIREGTEQAERLAYQRAAGQTEKIGSRITGVGSARVPNRPVPAETALGFPKKPKPYTFNRQKGGPLFGMQALRSKVSRGVPIPNLNVGASPVGRTPVGMRGRIGGALKWAGKHKLATGLGIVGAYFDAGLINEAARNIVQGNPDAEQARLRHQRALDTEVNTAKSMMDQQDYQKRVNQLIDQYADDISIRNPNVARALMGLPRITEHETLVGNVQADPNRLRNSVRNLMEQNNLLPEVPKSVEDEVFLNPGQDSLREIVDETSEFATTE